MLSHSLTHTLVSSHVTHTCLHTHTVTHTLIHTHMCACTHTLLIALPSVGAPSSSLTTVLPTAEEEGGVPLEKEVSAYGKTGFSGGGGPGSGAQETCVCSGFLMQSPRPSAPPHTQAAPEAPASWTFPSHPLPTPLAPLGRKPAKMCPPAVSPRPPQPLPLDVSASCSQRWAGCSIRACIPIPPSHPQAPASTIKTHGDAPSHPPSGPTPRPYAQSLWRARSVLGPGGKLQPPNTLRQAGRPGPSPLPPAFPRKLAGSSQYTPGSLAGDQPSQKSTLGPGLCPGHLCTDPSAEQIHTGSLLWVS